MASPAIQAIKYFTNFRPYVQGASPSLKECQAHFNAELGLTPADPKNPTDDEKADQNALYRRVRFLASVGEENGEIVRDGNKLVCMTPEQKAAHEQAQAEEQATVERSQGLLTAFGVAGKVSVAGIALTHVSFESLCEMVANASKPKAKGKGKAA